MFQLQPVVEHYLSRTAPWIGAGPADDWIVVTGEADDDTVRRIVAIVASASNVMHETLEATLLAMERKVREEGWLIASGGLRATDHRFELLPSCCCGLEGWREWYRVKPGGSSPWLGHDPNPWVDCRGEAAVLWTDDDGDGVSLTVPFDSVGYALIIVEDMLESFVLRLENWVAREAPAASGFPEAFATAFVRPRARC
jgi:hypothetical protein